MKTYIQHSNRMKMSRRVAACCLLLLALATDVLAQNDKPYVIKRTKYSEASGDHYLEHAKVDGAWVLRDATTFNPNCLWYSGRDINISGTNHNYYFIDEETGDLHFLSAPLEAGGALSLSASQPAVYLLNNTDQSYYFYDWDIDNRPTDGAGLARGHQYNGIANATECQACAGGQWDDDDEECWAVYWVEYDGSAWRLSTASQYNITENSGRYRLVTVEPFPMEVSGEGGLSSLVDFEMNYPSNQPLSATIEPFNYIPAYNKYTFNEVTNTIEWTITSHTYYYPNDGTITEPPTQTQPSPDASLWTYDWSISGAGAEYLSFSNEGTDMVHSSTAATPTLYYRIENNDGHKTATLTLTVTYQDGSTQTTSATVTVKTPCQNPSFSADVNYEGVTISWTPTAESYVVSWKKTDAATWSSQTVGNETSYTIIGLEYETTYDYRVKASCTSDEPEPLQFTTLNQPKAVVGGAVFGGGRMADVHGKTEVVIINTDSIGAVYGGNDIAGAVIDNAGSTIKLGVSASDPDAVTYNNSQASTKVRIGDVYGGGNGYYAYDGSTFVAADNEHTSFVVPAGGTVNAMTQSHTVGDVVWENETDVAKTLTIPTIIKTTITMATNAVKVDSIFGGAKNAFITNTDANANGTSIIVDGGTAYAVFGGNNYGGNQTAGKHHIEVNNTKNQTSGYPNGLGRDYGICYLFGGGNKVEGKITDITISGGMCDTVFGGGNAADVAEAHVLINCALDEGSGNSTFGNVFSNAISSYSTENGITINNGYDWDGTGIYNVRALFGGNNRADMSGLPTLTLTSGSVGTVYGGGNSGQMLAQIPDDANPETNPGTGPIATDFGSNFIGDDKLPIYYGTHVVMNSANMLVDYLYGGCQMSNVLYSTWVEIAGGHVGTVYGGCNISGDVGSLPVTPYNELPEDHYDEAYQNVQGATYVKASDGVVHGDLFAGSNGYYHCNNGVEYIDGVINLGHYVGMEIPTHNETHVKVSGDVVVKKNVYAGGNMAYVGFINATDRNYRYRDFVGFCSVRMDGGTVEGSVYGGGNRASIFGSNSVLVSGGSIGYIGDVATEGALYGGNDRAGQVAQITNRVLPDSNDLASDGQTNLNLMGVKTFVSVMGKPKVSTVYGGGNGAYDYTPDEYCDITDQPVQSNTFVDVNIDAAGGSETGGYINTVYGGGNGVTVLDKITVFVNVQNADDNPYDQVGTIFGGNNKGSLDILSDIILLNGQINTIYGGCNEGAMTGSLPYNGYDDLGSMVHLRSEYQPNGTGEPVATNAKVTGYVYGGCRSNGVTNNTLVLVDGGNHPATFFGGSDVSGDVGGTSQVIVNAGSTGNVYGGGNGNYDVYNDEILPPYCTHTDVKLLGGTCTGDVFGGGFAGECGKTNILIENGSVAGSVFGGGNQAGVVYEENLTTGNSTIIMNNGFVGSGIYGGCNAQGEIGGDVNISITNGTIGSADHRANVFGGGYGQPTTVAGDVTVTFGAISETHNDGLWLYGDLYGGSALGSVNTNGANQTIVNVYNGTITGTGSGSSFLRGNVFGGGLGSTNVAPAVNGRVHVNIGGENNEGVYFGQATLTGCNVYGCNNLNGSPQDQVYVDVYQTAHTTQDEASYYANDRTYAIYQVFGGGNQTDYDPTTNPGWLKLTHVHVHGCDNTIEQVFGASNAADAAGVYTVIDGGRFDLIFGGGNGIVAAANVYQGGTYSQVLGGHVGWCFGGSNRLGNCYNIIQDVETVGECGALVMDYEFSGGNIADQTGDVTLNFECVNAKSYFGVYGGCRLGTFYGNITINVYGGRIGTLYGGCQGDSDHPAHVKKYDADHYPVGHPELIGTGGNITINLYGGAVGDVYGGCDKFGNVEGKITINVNETNDECELFVGNIYGGNNQCDYAPIGDAANIATPEVNIINGTIGGDYDVVGDEGETESYEGNVFGGCNLGKATSNPLVLVGPDVTKTVLVKGNVFGGGNEGDIEGSPKVTVVPTTHSLAYSCEAAEGSIRVVSTNVASSPATISEGEAVVLLAEPAECYVFDHWELVSGTGASFASTSKRETIFTMGTSDASIQAVFASAGSNALTITPPESGGSFIVKNRNGNDVASGDQICQFAELVLTATPQAGFAFKQWIVTGGEILNQINPTTIFTMGNVPASITAEFEVAYPLTITAPESGGTIKVINPFGMELNGTVYVAPNTILTLQATPDENYIFGTWTCTGTGASIAQPTLTETFFTMGTDAATITATFENNDTP